MDGKAAPGQDRKKVIVSVTKGTQLRESYRQFNNLVQKSHQKFSQSQQDTYYMISTKWLKQLEEFCEHDSAQRYQPSQYNVDLLEADHKTLKKGLSEGADFQIVNTDAFQLLENFKGIKLMRKARMVGHEKRVQIYLSIFKVLILSNTNLREIDRKEISKEQFSKRLIEYQQSEQATVSQFCESLSLHEKLNSNVKSRLWRIDKDITLDKMFNHIVEQTKPISYHSDYKIKFLGRRIEDEDCKLCDLNLVEGDYFVFQHKTSKDWYLQADNEGKCQNCYQIKKLQFPCGCKKVAYCTQACKQKDKRYHLNRCSFAQQEQINKKVEMGLTENSSRGLTGLTNLGNTCFMNSCLQSLSHTLPLTYYFINQHFEDEINKENPLGSKGKLAKSYAKFIKGVWCDSDNTFSPYSLKSAVGSINPIFSGYAQHDSQQFFSFLIDGLHQDLNRIGKKPYVESVQSKGRADKIVATQSWMTHIRRNQSIIVDLMTGQYKSKVICPDCQFQSITFDPFITVTLPIPQQTTSRMQFFVIHHNFSKQTKKMAFNYKKASKEEWESKGAQLIGVDPKFVRFYVLTMHEAIYKLGKASLNQIIHKVQNQTKNLFLIELSEDEIKFSEPLQFVTRLSKKSNYYSSHDNVWFKFPLLFQKSKTNGKDIYKRILKFLYNQAYDNSSKKSTIFGGKSYQEYEKIMLQNRPFQLVLRYEKKVEKYYHRSEYKFESQRVIKDDSTIQQILEGTTLDDCQLDARFSKDGMKDFTFEQLKHFKDTVEKYSRRNESNEDITVTLQQCLDNLRQPEKLQAGNEWYCPKCKDHKLATKEIDIYKAPKILILHLKRFKQKGNYRKEKNQSKVIFSMNFDFTPYLIDPTPMSTYTEEATKQGFYIKPSYQEEKMTPEKAQYQLYAVSNHYGGLGGGHYTAYAKNDGKWYEFNDSSVRSCSESSVCSSGAYILFYKRKD